MPGSFEFQNSFWKGGSVTSSWVTARCRGVSRSSAAGVLSYVFAIGVAPNCDVCLLVSSVLSLCRCAPGPPAARIGTGLVPSCHDATVDVENRAGDPAGVLGEQVGDRGGDVLRRAYPAQRVEAVEAGQRGLELVLGDEAFIQRGRDDGRCHGVDPDLVRGKLHGQVAG